MLLASLYGRNWESGDGTLLLNWDGSILSGILVQNGTCLWLGVEDL